MEDIIYGKNAVLEAIESQNREINKVIIPNIKKENCLKPLRW